MSEFVWDEKLVREFLRWFATSHSPEEQEETLAKFKASKQPKPSKYYPRDIEVELENAKRLIDDVQYELDKERNKKYLPVYLTPSQLEKLFTLLK
jgi:hypothetical protein